MTICFLAGLGSVSVSAVGYLLSLMCECGFFFLYGSAIGICLARVGWTSTHLNVERHGMSGLWLV